MQTQTQTHCNTGAHEDKVGVWERPCIHTHTHTHTHTHLHTQVGKPIPEEHRATHIPGTVSYGIAEVMTDLLNFAVKYLRKGGRLVYWLPTTSEYSEVCVCLCTYVCVCIYLCVCVHAYIDIYRR
jgi:hypothetical protein